MKRIQMKSQVLVNPWRFGGYLNNQNIMESSLYCPPCQLRTLSAGTGRRRRARVLSYHPPSSGAFPFSGVSLPGIAPPSHYLSGPSLVSLRSSCVSDFPASPYFTFSPVPAVTRVSDPRWFSFISSSEMLRRRWGKRWSPVQLVSPRDTHEKVALKSIFFNLPMWLSLSSAWTSM